MTKILCIGDWGEYFSEDMKMTIDKQYYDMIFLLGDNFYPDGIKKYKDNNWNKLYYNFPKNIIKYVVLGNHDYIGNIHYQLMKTFSSNYFSWYLPHFFYDIKDENNSVHYIYIDTQLLSLFYTSNMLSSSNVEEKYLQKFFKLYDIYHLEQKKWLENTLEKSSFKWKIICGHYPIISGGPHQHVNELSEYLEPLLYKYNVDLYVSGHDHNSQLLKKNNTLFAVCGGSTQQYKTETINVTIYQNSNKSLMELNITKDKLEIYNIENNLKKIIYCKKKII